ncbi:MAG TPA: MgtC/SapB family protein [Acholeplasmataceae bacterium]|jgi:putative Mg2+ transporter-C (MgtC) family protein|nr:MgtC/SapB family protein [Acholeplasmataceae bacterium]
MFDWANDYFNWAIVGEQILRLVAAAICGGIIGYEREIKNKPAGYVTFILVAVGACLIAILQVNLVNLTIYTIEQKPHLHGVISTDVGRVIAQVVSGIGFLGAGTIIHNRGTAKGITTAALLWVSAALGLVIGIGGRHNYILAFATAVILIPFSLLTRKYGRKIAEKRKTYRIYIVFEEEYEKEMYQQFAELGAVVKKSFFHNKYRQQERQIKEVFIYFTVTKKNTFSGVVNEIAANPWVVSVEEA